MRYVYATATLVGDYSTTITSTFKVPYKIDNVTFKYPTKFTGTLNIGIDAEKGSTYDFSIGKSIIDDDGGTVHYSGLEMYADKFDAITISTSSYPLTGTTSVRIGLMRAIDK